MRKYGTHQHAVMMTKSEMEPANTESHEAADIRASTPVKNIDEPKPSSPPPIRPPAKPSHHPPKVKQWAVTTMIPFEKTENGGGVPVEDLNAISRDPLSKTYSDILRCSSSPRQDRHIISIRFQPPMTKRWIKRMKRCGIVCFGGLPRYKIQ